MDITGFLKAIASVRGSWSLAAFAISALLAVVNVAVGRRRGVPTNSIVWGVVVVICVLGLAPTMAQAYLKRLEIVRAVYLVRVIVVDSQNVPVSGATIKTTVSSETTTSNQGIAQISIPQATMPRDGKITIYADLDSACAHGHSDIRLANELNPQVSVSISASNNAVVSGLVEDAAGGTITGATVSVLGGETTVTAPDGRFTVKANTCVGQQVRLHAQKVGYQSVDQYHPAGPEPATIVLRRAKGSID